ncbi:hypothetical protein BpHYR1_024684 [Brachionus plicatilis]|uniref:Uncharacterized protein n=1 Tax=Brachionus plicatilis TaxID=10195 RepID=A0A3M7RXV1_BRAPC|nr:hypothetical protein BpHYR1_024684 [Brachionus plicatilis]
MEILFQHNQFLISTMKKTFNTIRFLLSTKNLEVRQIKKPFFRNFCSTSFSKPLIFVLNVSQHMKILFFLY